MADFEISHLFISAGHNYFGRHEKPPGEHPIIEVERIQCVTAKGIAGDRFFGFKKQYKGQITFFEEEVYQDLCLRFGVRDRSPEAFRRNVITRGVRLNELIGREFELQGIRFFGNEECRPCYWMDLAFAPGAEGALKGRGGLRAEILSDGFLTRSASTSQEAGFLTSFPPARSFPVQSKTATLTINEIYRSIQGESTWAGVPCVFVRLTFCDLRCNYCDTAYAFYAGNKMTLSEIIERILTFNCSLVEITGGEPLLQKNVLPLMKQLCDLGKTLLIETSGAHDISGIDPRVHRIMDLKTPGSGEAERNRYENIPHLTKKDEVKFVIGSREDYLWSREKIGEFDLSNRCGTVLFSPIFGRIEPREIVDWLLEDQLVVRFQLQMHKFIWPPEMKGV